MEECREAVRNETTGVRRKGKKEEAQVRRKAWNKEEKE